MGIPAAMQDADTRAITTDPIWSSRDRFVLSDGHVPTLPWSLLHRARIGHGGTVIGRRALGASAPLEQLLTTFDFTPDRVTAAVG